MEVRKLEPAGKIQCPACGGWYLNIKLFGVHLTCGTACRRWLVEDDRIQLLDKHDPLRRLILTDSVFLEICNRGGKGKKTYDVTLRAVSVGGEFVNVATWNRPQFGRMELEVRRNAPRRRGL